MVKLQYIHEAQKRFVVPSIILAKGIFSELRCYGYE